MEGEPACTCMSATQTLTGMQYRILQITTQGTVQGYWPLNEMHLQRQPCIEALLRISRMFSEGMTEGRQAGQQSNPVNPGSNSATEKRKNKSGHTAMERSLSRCMPLDRAPGDKRGNDTPSSRLIRMTYRLAYVVVYQSLGLCLSADLAYKRAR